MNETSGKEDVLTQSLQDFLYEFDRDCNVILATAAQEYASDGDPLENFDVRGQLLDLTARQVLLSDLGKHFISICKGVSIRETMRGRIIDAINYLRLYAYMRSLEGIE